ncbi:hypothetical protein PV328_003946 [Microctonus aethiopoides]|uniref:Small ribosomal subunit protein uS5 n=1 Tax=Microctonus aethiopoides TaxID=144406 RepID=A0AA39F9P9_9HYME|nr:hypothetical protein PV328_003946 [Microctonus aethiopoides]
MGMADSRHGFRGGFGSRGGASDRGGGEGGRERGSGKEGQKEWIPLTKLGRLVKAGKINSLEEIHQLALPLKEFEIIDQLFGSSLKDEVLKIILVQNQTRDGQHTHFKVFVVVGDSNGHIGLGIQCSEEEATAIREEIILAKLSVVPIQLTPAPRGTGIVSAPVPEKMLQMAGIEDCYTSVKGATDDFACFAKATFDAIAKTHQFQTPAS